MEAVAAVTEPMTLKQAEDVIKEWENRLLNPPSAAMRCPRTGSGIATP